MLENVLENLKSFFVDNMNMPKAVLISFLTLMSLFHFIIMPLPQLFSLFMNKISGKAQPVSAVIPPAISEKENNEKA